MILEYIAKLHKESLLYLPKTPQVISMQGEHLIFHPWDVQMSGKLSYAGARDVFANETQRIFMVINSYSASHDNWCPVGGDGGCRVGEVRAGTTSPMPDHKGFKLQ